jgi:hypothetical protein
MPPKVKDYQAMLKPVVEMFAKYAPITGEPLVVDNADTGSPTNIWLMIAWTMNDIRAIPTTTCGRHPPCFCGGCNSCIQRGIRLEGQPRTIVPGAVRALGEGHVSQACIYTRDTHRTYCHTLVVCMGIFRMMFQYWLCIRSSYRHTLVVCIGIVRIVRMIIQYWSCIRASYCHTLVVCMDTVRMIIQ